MITFLCRDDGWLTPVLRQRHIGIDQGILNWAMFAVDVICSTDGVQTIKAVAADLCDLKGRGLDVNSFDTTSLLLCLQQHTPLMSWIQHPSYAAVLQPVERVIVHLENISKRNRYDKHFTVKFGTLLQRLMDPAKSIVKMSNAFQRGARGPSATTLLLHAA